MVTPKCRYSLQNTIIKLYADLIMHIFNFLHNRPWISLWIKSITNELDIIIHSCLAIVTSSAIDCDVISWTKIERGDTGTMCKDHRFCCVYGFVRLCKKQSNVCTLVTNSFCAHSSVIFATINTKNKNTKITLLWALKQFVTRVHTLFSIDLNPQYTRWLIST